MSNALYNVTYKQTLKMGNVPSSSEQRRSRRRFTIAESSVKLPSTKEPFLFATEPKYNEKAFDHIVEFILFYFSNVKYVQVLLIQHVYLTDQALERKEGDQVISMVYKS